MLPNGWSAQPLGELTENFDALRVPIKSADRTPGPYPYFGASGIVDHVDDYIFDGEYLLIAEDGENLRTRYTPISFLASGRFWVNNHAHIVRGNGRALTRFLNYALSVTDISGYLTGSTMPKLTQGNMNRIILPTPSVQEQGPIVEVLGSLDDKIDLNRRMNETLEAMARALFKSWFVDFDPVYAKTEGRQPAHMDADTAALFPDAFDDEGRPMGWRWAPVSEVVEINPREKLSKGEETPYVEMADLFTNLSRTCVPRQRAFKSGSKFRDGDTLLARITPCLENGKTAFVDTLGPGIVGWGSTEFIVLRPISPLPAEYGYLLARSAEFRDHAIKSMTGTSGRQRVQPDAVGRFLVCIPPDDVSVQFGKIVRPWFEKIKMNAEQSGTLAALRDTLLPRLMSGEICVRDAEKEVEAAE